MKHIILALALVLMPSCSTFQKLKEGIESTREVLVEVRDTVRQVRPVVSKIVEDGKVLAENSKELLFNGATIVKDLSEKLPEIKQAARSSADRNQDGELSWGERIGYITALLAGIVAFLRRKLKGSEDGLAALNARIDHERQRRKEAEARITPVPPPVFPTPVAQPATQPHGTSESGKF